MAMEATQHAEHNALDLIPASEELTSNADDEGTVGDLLLFITGGPQHPQLQQQLQTPTQRGAPAYRPRKQIG